MWPTTVTMAKMTKTFTIGNLGQNGQEWYSDFQNKKFWHLIEAYELEFACKQPLNSAMWMRVCLQASLASNSERASSYTGRNLLASDCQYTYVYTSTQLMVRKYVKTCPPLGKDFNIWICSSPRLSPLRGWVILGILTRGHFTSLLKLSMTCWGFAFKCYDLK